jgi:uncharacterized membrane protein YbhN (UPF0104 family)
MTRRLIQIAKITAVAAVLVLLWHHADGHAALALLQAAEPLWLVAALLALTLQTLLSAQRWRLTAARLGLVFSFSTAVREYYLAQVLNQSLPGGVLGDAGRALRSRRDAGLLVAGQAVFFERLAGQIGLLVLLALCLGMSLALQVQAPWPEDLRPPFIGTFALLLLLAAAAGIFLRLQSRWETALHRGLRAFVHAVLARDVLPRQTALSLGTALCNVVAFACSAAAVGTGVPIVFMAILAPVILFAMVLPVSVGGWGLREAAAALLFPVVGATASEGLAASVAFGLMFLVATVPGLVLLRVRPNVLAPDNP